MVTHRHPCCRHVSIVLVRLTAIHHLHFKSELNVWIWRSWKWVPSRKRLYFPPPSPALETVFTEPQVQCCQKRKESGIAVDSSDWGIGCHSSMVHTLRSTPRKCRRERDNGRHIVSWTDDHQWGSSESSHAKCCLPITLLPFKDPCRRRQSTPQTAHISSPRSTRRKNANICAQSGHGKGGENPQAGSAHVHVLPNRWISLPILRRNGQDKGKQRTCSSHLPGQPTWLLSSKPSKECAPIVPISKHRLMTQQYKNWWLWFLNSLPDQQHNLDWRMSVVWVHRTLALPLSTCSVVFFPILQVRPKFSHLHKIIHPSRRDLAPTHLHELWVPQTLADRQSPTPTMDCQSCILLWTESCVFPGTEFHTPLRIESHAVLQTNTSITYQRQNLNLVHRRLLSGLAFRNPKTSPTNRR